MKPYFSIFLMLLLLLNACKNEKKETEAPSEQAIQDTSVIKSDTPIIRLSTESKDLVASWPEYQRFDDLIGSYQEITMSEALLNSVELSELAKQLRDSVRVDQLNIPEVKIRLNVLYSEALRLADMSSIPTITETHVLEETTNVIEAYSALNLKINNMKLQDELNDEISQFVDEVLDTTAVDSIPDSEALDEEYEPGS